MEASGSPGGKVVQQLTGLPHDAASQSLMKEAGVDRLGAFTESIETARRGTISLVGVYGGMADS